MLLISTGWANYGKLSEQVRQNTTSVALINATRYTSEMADAAQEVNESRLVRLEEAATAATTALTSQLSSLASKLDSAVTIMNYEIERRKELHQE